MEVKAENHENFNDFISISKEPINKSWSEKFYHKIPVRHYGLTKYPGRFGSKKEYPKECGTFKSFYSCEKGCCQKVFLHTCNNINCPRCYIFSIRNTARRTAERFTKIIEFWDYLGITKAPLKHYSFNILPVSIPNKLSFKNVKKEIIKIIRENGGNGILIYHPYRRKKSRCHGKRYYVRPQEMVYSPHFHFIGHIWIRKGKSFQKKYGFNYSYIRTLHNEHMAYTAIKYCLTHAGYFSNSHILIWFGQYSYSKLIKINEYKEVETIYCEICEFEIFKVDLTPVQILEYKDRISIPWYYYDYFNYNHYLKDVKIIYDLKFKKSK